MQQHTYYQAMPMVHTSAFTTAVDINQQQQVQQQAPYNQAVGQTQQYRPMSNFSDNMIRDARTDEFAQGDYQSNPPFNPYK